MKRIVSRAHKKSMSSLKDYFRTGPARGYTLEDIGVDNCKRFLQKTVWGHLNEIANERFGFPEGEQDSRGGKTHGGSPAANLDDALRGLGDYVVNSWMINKTSGWAEVILQNNSYWITLSKGKLYVTSSTMKTFSVRMPQEKMAQMLFAYDAYMGSSDIDRFVEEAYREYMAEEKAAEVLTVAVKSLVEDIWPENTYFSVRQQKNGRLCCTFSSPYVWDVNVTFRTDIVNFREDFIKAHERFKRKSAALEEDL